MKSIHHINFFSAIFLIIHLTSCEKPNVVEDSQLLASLYTNSVDTLVIQNNKYILETYLYRDFFPRLPIPRKSPLIADIYLVNLDSLPILDNIQIQKLYIIQNQLIWISSFKSGVQPKVPDFKLNKLIRDGPEWATNTYVDAVIKIVNNLTLEEYFLIARHQYIIRTE